MKVSRSDCHAINDILDKLKQDALAIEDINTMAAELNFSVSKLNKVFKEYVGIGPATYLRNTKMDMARRIHEDKALSWTEIAYQLGYSDIAAFSKAYKRIFGTSPTTTTK